MKKILSVLLLILALCLSFTSCFQENLPPEPAIKDFSYDENLNLIVKLAPSEEYEGYFTVDANGEFDPRELEYVSSDSTVAIIEYSKLEGNKLYFYIVALTNGECTVHVQTADLVASSYVSVIVSDKENGNLGDTGGDLEHEHTLKDAYTADGHFKECECGYKTSVTAHTLKDAYTADGHFKECECGYKTSAEQHSLSLKYSDSYHWNACECGYYTAYIPHSISDGKCDNCPYVYEEPEQNPPTPTVEIPATTRPSFDFDALPEYVVGGKTYATINNNIPYFTQGQIVTESYEYYSPLDKFGRCGITVACLGVELMPTIPRGDISSVKPTGWHQASYPSLSVSFLYNRCHLIGWQLTGEDANGKNLITGTITLNVGTNELGRHGMLDYENMIADYLKEFPENHVMYRVTPIFKDDELLARGVQLEAYSVEDNGEGICFNVFIYNVQDGVIIDYSTGQSQLDTSYDTGDDTTVNINNCTYVINSKNGKIHLKTCSYCPSTNALYTQKSLEELADEGYTDYCKICKPDLQ